MSRETPKMPPHPRGYGIAKKGDGAKKVRRQWRKWAKKDTKSQAAEAARVDCTNDLCNG